jgi:1,4-dihydroxy-6-naphthoate synthase
MAYARGMETGLADKFVGMYVNDYTLDYGDRGREAVRLLLERGHQGGIIPNPVEIQFF